MSTIICKSWEKQVLDNTKAIEELKNKPSGSGNNFVLMSLDNDGADIIRPDWTGANVGVTNPYGSTLLRAPAEGESRGIYIEPHASKTVDITELDDGGDVIIEFSEGIDASGYTYEMDSRTVTIKISVYK